MDRAFIVKEHWGNVRPDRAKVEVDERGID